MSKQTADILRKARALIDTPEKWTRIAFARTRDGNTCRFSDGRAVSFCIAGAVSRAELLAGVENTGNAIAAILKALPPPWAGNVAGFNDVLTTHHADVLAVFDRTIEAEDATP